MQRSCFHGSFRIGNLRDKKDLGNTNGGHPLPGYREAGSRERLRACKERVGYEKGVGVDHGERRRSTTMIRVTARLIHDVQIFHITKRKLHRRRAQEMFSTTVDI